jgi:hypothetical protein
MADYSNPLSVPNAFFTTPPIVIVVRHVRRTSAGEVVAEDANSLPRYLMRVDQQRVQPRPIIKAPPERNIPEHGARKKAY